MQLLRGSRALGVLACAGLLLPPTVAEAGPPVVSAARVNSALSIEDIALGDGQAFHGMVLSENGQPLAGEEVVVSQLGREVARTTSDESGHFAIQNLRGGLHLVRAGQGEGLYRFWTTGTAPPSARAKATLVDRVTVRGQRPFKHLFHSRAFILGVVIAAAIAIPIAVHDSRNDDRSGS
jgi:hypothetical protein